MRALFAVATLSLGCGPQVTVTEASRQDTAGAETASTEPAPGTAGLPAPGVSLGRFVSSATGITSDPEDAGSRRPTLPGALEIVGEERLRLFGPEETSYDVVVREEVVRATEPPEEGTRLDNRSGLEVWLVPPAAYGEDDGLLWVRDREGLLATLEIHAWDGGDALEVLRALGEALDEHAPLPLAGGRARFATAIGEVELDLPPGMIGVEHVSDEHGTTSWDLAVVRDHGRPFLGLALGWLGYEEPEDEDAQIVAGSVGPVALSFRDDGETLRAITDTPDPFVFVVAAPPGPERARLLVILAAARVTPNAPDGGP